MVSQPRRASDKTAFDLRVTLLGPDPAIWRRLQVPGDVRLSRLHAILQTAMGWEDRHLHSFEIAGQNYEPLDEDDDDDGEAVDEDSVRLSDLVEHGTSFSYLYDFGDYWNHEIVVESVGPVPKVLKVAVCLDGQRACPPEDCGGVHGFAGFLEAIGDPDHDEHRDYLEWVGGSYDARSFDLAATNAALQRVR